ncbi:MAG TPA: aryl-sulfate sulfotransferase [Acidimicrobiia bacterium]
MRRGSRGRTIGLVVAAVTLTGATAAAGGSGAGGAGAETGVTLVADGAYEGYTLIAPSESATTYLVDLDGEVVHEWDADFTPGLQVELLESGELLRPGKTRRETPFSEGNGRGGVIERLDWDGETTWRYRYADDDVMQHHDVEVLPNGNVVILAWELVDEEEALAAGRDPELLRDGVLWPEHLVEVDPATDAVVWEWHAWDHLVQDFDPAKPDYGDPATSPGRIDLNYVTDGGAADWMHANSVAYNPELDQIVLSVRSFHEIWVIDHSVDTEEARGPAGDLLFRWGNPAAYGKGGAAPRMSFGQHDAEWIAPGLDGAGRISVFNNGTLYRPYTTVEEIVPTMDGRGYVLDTNGVFDAEIARIVWPVEPDPEFFAHHTSGAQRLPNGNTLIADGPHGVVFEVTPAGEKVWEYVNPFFDRGAEVVELNDREVFKRRRMFRAERYGPDYPGLAALSAGSSSQ